MWPLAKLPTVAASAGTLLLGTVVAAGMAVYEAGMVRVRVEEKRPGGDNVHLVIPGALVQVGMKFVPDKELHRLPPEARTMMPVLRIASEELQRIPDGPLVEVREAAEHVLIVKRDGALIIDVDSESETVHVSIPLSTLAALARELEGAAPAP